MDSRNSAQHGMRRSRRGLHPSGEPSPPGIPGERSAAEREALLRVATAAAGAHGLEEVLELAAEEARTAISAASLSVSRWDRERRLLKTLINVGELGPGEQRFPADETYSLEENPLLAQMVRHGKPYFNAVDDPHADPAAVRILRSLGKESDVAVPVVSEGEIWGEVWASTGPGQPRFRATDVRFLEAIAGQLAVAIGRAELFSQVSRLAYEDPLTGLANRRALQERLERAAARSSRRGSPLTLLLCDVDNLKAINDGRGHEAGDRALIRVAEALVAASAERPGSLVGRLSGDEFCVLIEGAGLDAARALALRALATLTRDRDVQISISCGASASGPMTRKPEQLLRGADAAQYAAKRRGGGQFCTAEAGIVADHPQRDRRALRGSTADRVRAAAAEAVELLDGDFAGRLAIDRLEAVTAGVAAAVDAAAWAISFAGHGDSVIRSICTADDRDSQLRGLRVELEDEVYPLDEYPATERVMSMGRGTFLVDRHDPAADAAERALLEEMGHQAVLGVAAAAPDGTYLIELYGDAATAPLVEAQLELRLLGQAAIAPQLLAEGVADRLAERTRQLEVTSALGARLAGATDPDGILRATVEELSELGHEACAVVRVRGDGLVEIAADSEAGRSEGWCAPATAGLIGRCVTEGETVLADDVRDEPDHRTSPATAHMRSELNVAVQSGGRIWGAITVKESATGAFSADDARLVETVAEQLGSALHLAELYHQLERAYLGTAEALSAALEAKDAYTASHSASIVSRAEAVGRRLGMSQEELRVLRYGAAFHDIGKLAVPEAILNKRGPLDPDERREIELHTVVGERILAPIEFLAGVLPLVRHAHERWDGAGYPDRLGGDRIPLGARVIFACDAYDAMTSDRPYRRALNARAAREELVRGAGSQFDPRVVEALLAVLDEAGDDAASAAA